MLGLDLDEARGMGRVKELLRSLIDTGALKKVQRPVDAKGKRAPFVEAGRRAEVETPTLPG